MSHLLDAAEICFEDECTLEEALFAWDDSSADFADCVIGAKHLRRGCRATASFDAKAIKLPMFVAV
jgi:predicted nucleic-acid-binding protein